MFLPFAAVLLIEVAIALAALVLLERINLRQFRADTGQILQRVLVAELG